MTTGESLVWWTRACLLVVVMAVGAGGGALGQEDASAEKEARDGKDVSAAQQARIAQAVLPSLVRVEYWLKFDNGEAPYRGEDVITQERPVERTGWLIAPDKVLSNDHLTHQRFIRSITVTNGVETVEAEVESLATTQNAQILKLAKPLPQAKPFQVDAGVKGPLFVVTYGRRDGLWSVSVRSMGESVQADELGRATIPMASPSVIVDAAGVAAGFAMSGDLPADQTWKGSPLDWKQVSAQEVAGRLEKLQAACDRAVLRVKLNFRSPRRKAGGPFETYRSGDDAANVTQVDVLGVLVSPRRLIVLANLPPKVTARLDRITVFSAEGKELPATFAGTLSDYGCLLADMTQDVSGAATLSDADVRSLGRVVLPMADIRVQGDKRVSYVQHNRIFSLGVGWRRHLYPDISGSESNVFLFDDAGRLLALPMAVREKTRDGERFRSDEEPKLMPVAYLQAVLGDLSAALDGANVPLGEQQESRIAWLGVELQPLNPELARINKVSHLTNNGSYGALVSHVYENSPAQRAGIKVGGVLLRLHVDKVPKPIEVKVERYVFGDRPYPWDRWDELPEQYFDQVPRPWPPVENELTRQLTDLGEGVVFRADIFSDGQVATREMKIEMSPAHYDSAKRFKAKGIGLTVQDLTYEVRRYFQRGQDEGGVIVAKIEPGSKASVSGVKPFEIITHVNGQAVANVDDFERAAKDQPELRLSIKRMAKGRVVKVKQEPATAPTQPAQTQPATQPASAPTME